MLEISKQAVESIDPRLREAVQRQRELQREAQERAMRGIREEPVPVDYALYAVHAEKGIAARETADALARGALTEFFHDVERVLADVQRESWASVRRAINRDVGLHLLKGSLPEDFIAIHDPFELVDSLVEDMDLPGDAERAIRELHESAAIEVDSLVLEWQLRSVQLYRRSTYFFLRGMEDQRVRAMKQWRQHWLVMFRKLDRFVDDVSTMLTVHGYLNEARTLQRQFWHAALPDTVGTEITQIVFELVEDNGLVPGESQALFDELRAAHAEKSHTMLRQAVRKSIEYFRTTVDSAISNRPGVYTDELLDLQLQRGAHGMQTRAALAELIADPDAIERLAKQAEVSLQGPRLIVIDMPAHHESMIRFRNANKEQQ